jgi:septum formation protein
MNSTQTLPLILASGSPRRRELLQRAGIAFEIQPADIPEIEQPGEKPAAFARRLACDKALAVAQRVGKTQPRFTLGADTIVVVDGDILGKPRDEDNAIELLERLIGREHAVLTAVATASSETLEVRDFIVESRVTMRSVDRDELLAYVATGESLDKAGGYAVQGGARSFVTKIVGSETNVIGLPMDETLAWLAELGFEASR